eukprot:TRINITY_DN63162_c0_g1_i1.p1 TRINITY_DN63162_c0_g1~~TRINITY_DN63162_c0_g1_i1.p1  ORF type:complete len:324 (+),score=41.52 TRINITY_DN63162_c0_g1_i1:70-1041(+)
MGAFVTCCRNKNNIDFDLNFASNNDGVTLKVVHVPETSDESLGTRAAGYAVGKLLRLRRLETPHGLEPLSARSRSTSSLWPDCHRVKAIRRFWHAIVDDARPEMQGQLLTLSNNREDRTMAAAMLDTQDAIDGATYAHRFNLAQRAHAEGEACPCVKVAVPVICTVASSIYPSLVPVNSICTLSPFPSREVAKFVFDGSEEWLEFPQAFFHYAAFSSNGKHLVCDLQGAEDEAGNVILIDPCVMRTEKPSVANIIGSVAPAVAAVGGVRDENGPTVERFDTMHPRCTQLCQNFDPQRKTAKRNVGLCGLNVTCGLGSTSQGGG